VSLDGILRIVAGVAAVALAGAPAASWVVGKVKARLSAGGSEAQAAAIGIREMRTVLDLAERCKAAGCVDGVSLCQQLIDVMLGGCPGKAKR
jgi:hypothetical protein